MFLDSILTNHPHWGYFRTNDDEFIIVLLSLLVGANTDVTNL